MRRLGLREEEGFRGNSRWEEKEEQECMLAAGTATVALHLQSLPSTGARRSSGHRCPTGNARGFAKSCWTQY